MPIKIIPGEQIPTSHTIVDVMVGNFLKNTYRTDPFNPTAHHVPKKLDPATDGYSIWFSKQEIDALFAMNIDPATDLLPTGLRIYLGMHGNSADEADINKLHPAYNGQYSTILVCTREENGLQQDILGSPKGNYVTISGLAATDYAGDGADDGHINPPPDNSTLSGCTVKPKL